MVAISHGEVSIVNYTKPSRLIRSCRLLVGFSAYIILFTDNDGLFNFTSYLIPSMVTRPTNIQVIHKSKPIA